MAAGEPLIPGSAKLLELAARLPRQGLVLPLELDGERMAKSLLHELDKFCFLSGGGTVVSVQPGRDGMAIALNELELAYRKHRGPTLKTELRPVPRTIGQ